MRLYYRVAGDVLKTNSGALKRNFQEAKNTLGKSFFFSENFAAYHEFY